MPLPRNDAAFGANLRAIFDRALASTTGAVEVACESKAEADALRFRLYAARSRENKAIRRIYGPDAPCAWDKVVLTIHGSTLRLTLADAFDPFRNIKEVDPASAPSTSAPGHPSADGDGVLPSPPTAKEKSS